jgi:hypothetical protein
MTYTAGMGMPPRDRHLLDDVPQDRRLVTGDALRVARGKDDAGAPVVADQAPHDGHDAEDPEQADARRVGAKVRHADGETEREQHGDDDGDKQDGVALVAGDLVVHRGPVFRLLRRLLGRTRWLRGRSRGLLSLGGRARRLHLDLRGHAEIDLGHLVIGVSVQLVFAGSG